MRVGGAQSLASEGLGTWAIQLLRRWGSDAVFGLHQISAFGSIGTMGIASARGPNHPESDGHQGSELLVGSRRVKRIGPV